MKDKTTGTIKKSVPSWAALSAESPEAASRFYSSLLDWKTPVKTAGIGSKIGSLRAMWRVFINVADLDSTKKTVVKAGGKVLQELNESTNTRAVIFADPFGAEFAVREAASNSDGQSTGGSGTFAWSELIYDDILACGKFYGEVFGWTLSAPLPGDKLGRREWLVDGKAIAGLLPRPSALPKEIPPYWDIFFSVTDPDLAVKAAQNLGGKNLMPPTDIPHGRIAVFSDPAGTIFSVIKTNNNAGH